MSVELVRPQVRVVLVGGRGRGVVRVFGVHVNYASSAVFNNYNLRRSVLEASEAFQDSRQIPTVASE